MTCFGILVPPAAERAFGHRKRPSVHFPDLLDDVHDPDLPSLSPCLQGVAEHAYEICEDGVPRVSRSAKPVMELALLAIGLLCEV